MFDFTVEQQIAAIRAYYRVMRSTRAKQQFIDAVFA